MEDEDYDEVIGDLVQAVQQGDLEAVKATFQRPLSSPMQTSSDTQPKSNSKGQLHYIPAEIVDRDGCTLLHWAAINNRRQIAQYLLSRSTAVSYTPTGDRINLVNTPGGILNETPLQWALRKKFYSMMDLLFQHGASLSHKSSQGTDALHIACRSGDLVAVFLLLHWGADPNSLDSSGDTPTLWLIKNRVGQSLTLDIIRLLLQYQANMLIADSSGDTALHLLARRPVTKTTDLILALAIHKAGGRQIMIVKNSEQMTPYKVAIQSNNRQFVWFLFNMVMYTLFPSPIAPFSASFVTSFSFVLLLLYLRSIFLAGVYWAVLYFLVFQNVLSWSIIHQIGYLYFGFFVCLVVSRIIGFVIFVMPHISASTSAFVVLPTVVVYICLIALAHLTRPAQLPSVEPAELCKQIILSSPQEGLEEEADGTLDAALDNLILLGGGRPRVPRICTVCLVNKRLATTHCKYCGICVVGLDHHDAILNNCIGKGNRRLFVLYLLGGLVFNAVYIYTSAYADQVGICSSAKGIFWNILAVDWCVLWRQPLDVLLRWGAIYHVLNISSSIQIQLLCLVHETTIFNLLHGRRAPSKNITLGHTLRVLSRFFLTGAYDVTLPSGNPADQGGQPADDSIYDESSQSLLHQQSFDSGTAPRSRLQSFNSIAYQDDEFISDEEEDLLKNHEHSHSHDHSHSHGHGHEGCSHDHGQEKLEDRLPLSMSISALNRV